MKKINSTQRDTYAQISKAYTPANSTQRGTGADLSPSRVWAKHQSCAPSWAAACFLLFHSAEIKVLWNTEGSSSTAGPVMGRALIISSLQTHSCKWSSSTLIHRVIWAVHPFHCEKLCPPPILLYPLDCSSSYYASSLSIRGGTEVQHFLHTFCNILGKFALSSVNLTSLAKTADSLASPHQLMALACPCMFTSKLAGFVLFFFLNQAWGDSGPSELRRRPSGVGSELFIDLSKSKLIGLVSGDSDKSFRTGGSLSFIMKGKGTVL